LLSFIYRKIDFLFFIILVFILKRRTTTSAQPFSAFTFEKTYHYINRSQFLLLKRRNNTLSDSKMLKDPISNI